MLSEFHATAVKRAESNLNQGNLEAFWQWNRVCMGLKRDLDRTLSQTANGGAANPPQNT